MISAMPMPKQAIRAGGTGRPWRASVRARNDVGAQRRARRQQLQRLEYAAADVSEGRDHRTRGYAGASSAAGWPTGSPGAEPGACSSTSVSRRRYSVRCMREITSRWIWAVPSKIW